MNKSELTMELHRKYPRASASQVERWVEDRMMTPIDKVIEREAIKFDTIISMIKERGCKADIQELKELEESFNNVIKARRNTTYEPQKTIKPLYAGKTPTHESERAKKAYEDEETNGIL